MKKSVLITLALLYSGCAEAMDPDAIKVRLEQDIKELRSGTQLLKQDIKKLQSGMQKQLDILKRLKNNIEYLASSKNNSDLDGIIKKITETINVKSQKMHYWPKNRTNGKGPRILDLPYDKTPGVDQFTQLVKLENQSFVPKGIPRQINKQRNGAKDQSKSNFSGNSEPTRITEISFGELWNYSQNYIALLLKKSGINPEVFAFALPEKREGVNPLTYQGGIELWAIDKIVEAVKKAGGNVDNIETKQNAVVALRRLVAKNRSLFCNLDFLDEILSYLLTLRQKVKENFKAKLMERYPGENEYILEKAIEYWCKGVMPEGLIKTNAEKLRKFLDNYLRNPITDVGLITYIILERLRIRPRGVPLSSLVGSTQEN